MARTKPRGAGPRPAPAAVRGRRRCTQPSSARCQHGQSPGARAAGIGRLRPHLDRVGRRLQAGGDPRQRPRRAAEPGSAATRSRASSGDPRGSGTAVRFFQKFGTNSRTLPDAHPASRRSPRPAGRQVQAAVAALPEREPGPHTRPGQRRRRGGPGDRPRTQRCGRLEAERARQPGGPRPRRADHRGRRTAPRSVTTPHRAGRRVSSLHRALLVHLAPRATAAGANAPVVFSGSACPSPGVYMPPTQTPAGRGRPRGLRGARSRCVTSPNSRATPASASNTRQARRVGGQREVAAPDPLEIRVPPALQPLPEAVRLDNQRYSSGSRPCWRTKPQFRRDCAPATCARSTTTRARRDGRGRARSHPTIPAPTTTTSASRSMAEAHRRSKTARCQPLDAAAGPPGAPAPRQWAAKPASAAVEKAGAGEISEDPVGGGLGGQPGGVEADFRLPRGARRVSRCR